jgi:N,N'-diacetyllegionaminate synthase
MSKVFIIAEAGVNHNGSLELAKQLVDVAKLANCDAVKFQTFIAENLVSKIAKKAEYQIKNTEKSAESQLEMVKKLELSFDDFRQLKSYCEQKEIMFLSTPFDHESIDFLASIGVEIFKIPSGEITNLPYLRKINSLQREVILSTGMANMEEIAAALKLLKDCKKITVLHANTEYPTPMQDVNLLAMQTIAKEFNVAVGYSDHTAGIEVPVAAVALGAKIIEKHFTLDKNLPGQIKASLEPDELKKMVEAIRNIESALGSKIKAPSNSEQKNIAIARKSLVAKCAIKKGDVFSEKNLTAKRPGNGISPMRFDEFIGQVASKDYDEDELI